MRIIVGLLIVVAVIGGVFMHNRREQPPAATSQVASVAAEPASTREPSQHNWPKSALDRAADLKKQVAAQRKSNAAEEK